MMPAPLQSRVLKAASDAPGLAATLMNTASQIGIAGGAAFGAFLLSSGYAYSRSRCSARCFMRWGWPASSILIAYDRRLKPAAA